MLIYERDTARTMGFFVGHKTIDVETETEYVIFDKISVDTYRVRVYDKLNKVETDNEFNREEAFRIYRHYTVFYGWNNNHEVDISAWD